MFGRKLKFQSITSTLSCMLVLMLMGLTVLSVLAAGNFKEYLRENLTLTLTLGGTNEALLGHDQNTPAQTTMMLATLKSENFVREVKLTTADEVLQQQTPVIGGDPLEFLGFNPFYNEIEIGLNPDYANPDSIERIVRHLTVKYPLVSEVNYEHDMVQNLSTNVRKLNIILLGLSGILLVILFTLINNMVHLTIYGNRHLIHTMKLVGASWDFIRRPFLLRSLWMGLASGIGAVLLLLCALQWVFSIDASLHQFITSGDILNMSLVVILVGLLLLLLCTFVSVTHFIRMRGGRIHQ